MKELLLDEDADLGFVEEDDDDDSDDDERAPLEVTTVGRLAEVNESKHELEPSPN